MSMRMCTRPALADFIGPCLPSTSPKLPSGPQWIYEVKHDGFRLMARRDAAGVRLLTRNGNDCVNSISGRARCGMEAEGALTAAG